MEFYFCDLLLSMYKSNKSTGFQVPTLLTFWFHTKPDLSAITSIRFSIKNITATIKYNYWYLVNPDFFRSFYIRTDKCKWITRFCNRSRNYICFSQSNGKSIIPNVPPIVMVPNQYSCNSVSIQITGDTDFIISSIPVIINGSGTIIYDKTINVGTISIQISIATCSFVC